LARAGASLARALAGRTHNVATETAIHLVDDGLGVEVIDGEGEGAGVGEIVGVGESVGEACVGVGVGDGVDPPSGRPPQDPANRTTKPRTSPTRRLIT
jgi:hypothetical protein